MASLGAPSSADIERLQQELRQMKSTVHVSLRDILSAKDQEIARITLENQRLSAALSEQHVIASEAQAQLAGYRGASASLHQTELQRNNLEQQIALRDREIHELRSELDAAQNMIEQERDASRKAEQNRADHHAVILDELEAVRPRVTELVELNRSLQYSLDSCTQDLTFTRREYERLFGEHTVLQSEATRLRNEVSALRVRAEESEAAEGESLAFKRRLYAALPEMTSAVEVTLQVMDETLAAMRAGVEASTKERAEQAHLLTAQGAELQSLRSERHRTSDLEAAQRGMRAALSELHAQLQANGSHFAALRDLVVRAAEDAKPLKELQHKEAAIERLTTELATVNEHLAVATSECAEWKSRADRAEAEKAQLERLVSEKEAEMQREIRTREGTLEREVRARDSQIARAREEEQRARDEAAKEHENNSTLQESARALRAQLADLRRANEEEAGRAAEARDHVTRLERERRTLEERMGAARAEAEAHSKETAKANADLLVERATRRQEAEVNAHLRQLVEKMRAQLASLLEGPPVT